MTLVDHWKQKLDNEIKPRVQELNIEEGCFYDCIIKGSIYDPIKNPETIKTIEDAVSRCHPNLNKDQIQKVWDIICIKENFENNLRMAEFREKDPKQFEAFSRAMAEK